MRSWTLRDILGRLALKSPGLLVRSLSGGVSHFVSATLLSIALTNASCLPVDQPLVPQDKGKDTAPTGGFTGLTAAQTLSATKVGLSWQASTSSDTVAYSIYDVSILFSPRLIKTVKMPATSTTITGLTAQTLYAFRVRATNKDGVEDANMNDLQAIPYGGVLTAQVTSSTSAVIPFNEASNADDVNIYCKTDADGEYQIMSGTKDMVLNQLTLTGLSAGTTYTCRAALVVGDFEDNNTVTTTFTPIGQASKLVYTTQPGNGIAGAALTAQPVIKVMDSSDNVVSSGPDSRALITLTIASSSPTQGTIRGTATVAAVKGVATFTGLNFQESGSKILTATKQDTSSQTYGSETLTADSASFIISPGSVSAAGSTIAISPVPPPSLVANGSAAYTVTIVLKDQYGNAITGVKPTIGSSVSGDSITQPAVATDASGQTTGSINTTIADGASARYIYIKSPSGLTAVTALAPFVHGSATKLAFSVQPVNSPAGLLGMSQVKVAVQDAQGNTVTSGTAATATINLTISANLNGATLSGTTSAVASGGVAIFSDLGIDKTQTGYKLLASSGSYSPAYSNSFNITAGTPRKIIMSGPASTVSGSCSTAITIQLQDVGSNAANAVQNTPLQLSGLGNASLYSSSACAGSPLSSTLTFTAGTNTKTVYFKDLYSESVTITATDASSVLTSGTLTTKSTPSKVTMYARMPLPASPDLPMSVVAGQCSPPITITPAGDNGVAGPVFSATAVSIVGISGSSAKLYKDASCTEEITDPTNVTLPITSGTNYTTSIYLMDPKAETLSLLITDPLGIMDPLSGLQNVIIGPSNIEFTGPSTVISGICSTTAYTIRLKDTLGNTVIASANTALTINGLSSSAGSFYILEGCSGSSSKVSASVPINQSSVNLYFKDLSAETLNIYITDPAGKLAQSQTVTVGVSPSALSITGPTTAATSICAGPFTLSTMDANNTITAAITPITATLSGAGTAGGFFSDNACSATVSSFTFSTGESSKTFYYLSHYPINPATFTATPSSNLLTAGTKNFTVTAAKAWVGADATNLDSNGNLIWFTKGQTMAAPRIDGAQQPVDVDFDPTFQYMYVTDQAAHRILKYDYVNKTYVGWIGRYSLVGGVGVAGSTLATPSSNQCIATTNNSELPGWCVGGNSTNGTLSGPSQTVVDSNYIYVYSSNNWFITRYNAQTGAYAGWIGRANGRPTAAAAGGPASCTTMALYTGSPYVSGNTPGWCMGGSSTTVSRDEGDGSFRSGVYTMITDGTYMYVADLLKINRFLLSDGSFQGWIGLVGSTPTGGAAGCTTTTSNNRTPGWCTGGGVYGAQVNPTTTTPAVAGTSYGTGGAVWQPFGLTINNGILYVMNDWSGSPYITTYDVATGAYKGYLNTGAALSSNYHPSRGIVAINNMLYVASVNKISRFDLTGLLTGWMGKVNNNASMSGDPGCSTLQPNSNTPGWCLGGNARYGLDDGSFMDLRYLVYDGSDSFLAVHTNTYGAIKKYNYTTGEYKGVFGFKSTSPAVWSNNANTFAQFGGWEDNSVQSPTGIFHEPTTGTLYLSEWAATRVKRINPQTGAVLGWIGALISVPTGGVSGCTSANPFTGAPGWCLGAMFQPQYTVGWSPALFTQWSNGSINTPKGVTSDGSFVYVTDTNSHRILKFNATTGAYVGWIGWISSSPSGGATGCAGKASGTFTPGWCLGGSSTSGTGDGALNGPNNILVANGNLYVIDSNNHRVVSYDANTGAFNGWIGRINANPTSGCTYGSNGGYNVSTSGWCKGGTATVATWPNDRGGGFYFSGTNSGLTTDGSFLYITNYQNNRVDKYTFGGVYQASVLTRPFNYLNVWINNAAPTFPSAATLAAVTNTNEFPENIWTDGTNMYGVNWNQAVVWKMNLSTGAMQGWQGGINPGQSPTAGETGCNGATILTPGWCQGGNWIAGYKMGFLNSTNGTYEYYITGDSRFVYVSDTYMNRVTRFPK